MKWVLIIKFLIVLNNRLIKPNRGGVKATPLKKERTEMREILKKKMVEQLHKTYKFETGNQNRELRAWNDLGVSTLVRNNIFMTTINGWATLKNCDGTTTFGVKIRSDIMLEESGKFSGCKIVAKFTGLVNSELDDTEKSNFANINFSYSYNYDLGHWELDASSPSNHCKSKSELKKVSYAYVLMHSVIYDRMRFIRETALQLPQIWR